jgi:hypothetical protein
MTCFPSLKPADPWLRARMRLWSKMVDEGLFEGVAELSFSAMFRERMRNMSEEIRERRFRNIGDPRRRDRFMSTYELGVFALCDPRNCGLRTGIRDAGRYACRDRTMDRGRESKPCRYQLDAFCGAAGLPRVARSLDQGPAACRGLVDHGSRMAKLHERSARSNLGSRIFPTRTLVLQRRRTRFSRKADIDPIRGDGTIF